MTTDINQGVVTRITVFGIATLLLSLIILLDSFLPTNRIDVRVNDFISYLGSSRYGSGGSHLGIVTDDGKTTISPSLYYDLKRGDSIGIEKTMILHFARRFHFNGYIYENGSIYRIGKIPLCILLFTSVMCLIFRKDIYTGTLYIWVISSLFLFMIMSVLLISDFVIGSN